MPIRDHGKQAAFFDLIGRCSPIPIHPEDDSSVFSPTDIDRLCEGTGSRQALQKLHAYMAMPGANRGSTRPLPPTWVCHGTGNLRFRA